MRRPFSTAASSDDEGDDDDDDADAAGGRHPHAFATIPGLHPSSLHAVTHKLGLSNMTEIQHGTFEAARGGRDVLGRARTGTGKTLAFLLPAIEGPVKLAAVPILPETVAAATDEGEPKKKQPLTPATAAARGVERPNAARAAVYEAILAAAGAKSEATPAVAAAPTEKPDAPATPPAPAPEEDDGLGKVEDLLKPAP